MPPKDTAVVARRLVAESYDRVAPVFADAADHRVYRLLAVPLVGDVGRVLDPAGGTVLDIAAGSGAVGRSFTRSVSVDSSVEQLRHNRNGHRVGADGERLPFRSGSFAAAVCGFGINHVASPIALVREMARVAPIVGVSTWLRPEEPYAPKQLVAEVLARHAGSVRSEAGDLIDRYTDAVGSVEVITTLLRAAGLRADVRVAQVVIPWPGADAYLDYRLSMPTSAPAADDAALRSEVRAAVAALPRDALTWRPRLIVGVGRR